MSADADPRILALLEAHAKAVEAYGGTAPNIRAAEEEWDQAIASLAAVVEELQAALAEIVRLSDTVPGDHLGVIARAALARAAGQGRSAGDRT